jgi:hypothetical protein
MHFRLKWESRYEAATEVYVVSYIISSKVSYNLEEKHYASQLIFQSQSYRDYVFASTFFRH